MKFFDRVFGFLLSLLNERFFLVLIMALVLMAGALVWSFIDSKWALQYERNGKTMIMSINLTRMHCNQKLSQLQFIEDNSSLIENKRTYSCIDQRKK